MTIKGVGEVSFLPASVRLPLILAKNVASLTPNKCNYPIAPTEKLSLAMNQQTQRSLPLNYHSRSNPNPLRTLMTLNKPPDPKVIDHLPLHHWHLINSNDDQRLQSNHPPIPSIDHSSSQNHNPLLTPNPIAPLMEHGLQCPQS
jgi:hypothetical protein